MAVFLKNRKENDLPSFGFEDEGVYRLDDTASLFIKSIRELMGDKLWSKEALEEDRCQEARGSWQSSRGSRRILHLLLQRF